MLGRMATPRTPKTVVKRPAAAPRKVSASRQSAGKAAAKATVEAPAASASKRAAKPKASARAEPSAKKRAAVGKPRPRKAAAGPKPRTAAQRDSQFDTLVRAACLKAGTAAAISSITRRVPLLGRLAPTLLGPLAETVALAQVQRQLVTAIIELYEVELSDPETRGVVLLATATNIGAQQLSKRSLDAILKQFGEGLIGTVAARVLPMATILAEITAAVASTYTVAKRAQALCKLPGTGAGNLADLLRGLSGIDQQRLLSWSGEAFRLAIIPFRSVLGMLWR